MATPARSSRVNSALQVIQRTNDGMTVSDACRELGLARSTFYDIVKRNPEAIAEFQDIIEVTNREQLAMILVAKTRMLNKIIEDSLSDRTKPKDRLAIYMKLNELVNSLTKSQQIDNEKERQAHEFLARGPTLRPAKSRFTATETTVRYETEN